MGFVHVDLVEMGRQRAHFKLILQEVACANVRDFAESCMCLGRVVLGRAKFPCLRLNFLKQMSLKSQVSLARNHISVIARLMSAEASAPSAPKFRVSLLLHAVGLTKMRPILRHPFVQKAFGAIWSLGSLGPKDHHRNAKQAAAFSSRFQQKPKAKSSMFNAALWRGVFFGKKALLFQCFSNIRFLPCFFLSGWTCWPQLEDEDYLIAFISWPNSAPVDMVKVSEFQIPHWLQDFDHPTPKKRLHNFFQQQYWMYGRRGWENGGNDLGLRWAHHRAAWAGRCSWFLNDTWETPKSDAGYLTKEVIYIKGKSNWKSMIHS